VFPFVDPPRSPLFSVTKPIRGGMKAVEDMSESLNSLSQVISTSFSFAKSSPMKARQSLMSCAEYLQSKTFKSTSFVIRFWLVLIDLLKNEHVENLVLTVLSMLQQLISLLKSPEVQSIITQSLKLAASEPVTKLVGLLGTCAKSLFFILKTPEIAKFQEQIWELIEDETKREKEAQSDHSTMTKQPGMSSMDTIQEGYGYDDHFGSDSDDSDDSDGGGDGMGFMDSIDSTSFTQRDPEQCRKEEDEEKEIDPPSTSSKANATASISAYYSPSRAWNSITSMTSIFGGYDKESDDSHDDEVKAECKSTAMGPSDRHDDEQRSKTPPPPRSMENEPVDAVRRVQSGHEMPDKHQTKRSSRHRRSQSVLVSTSKRRSRRKMTSRSTGSLHAEYRVDRGFVSNVQEHSAPNVGRPESKSVGIEDWVLLIRHIDDLEDGGDISINEGDELRKLAMEQTMALLIIYKCYQQKKSRFIRYSRTILREDAESKQGPQQSQQKLKAHSAKSAVPFTESLDEMKLSMTNSESVHIEKVVSTTVDVGGCELKGDDDARDIVCIE